MSAAKPPPRPNLDARTFREVEALLAEHPDCRYVQREDWAALVAYARRLEAALADVAWTSVDPAAIETAMELLGARDLAALMRITVRPPSGDA